MERDNSLDRVFGILQKLHIRDIGTMINIMEWDCSPMKMAKAIMVNFKMDLNTEKEDSVFKTNLSMKEIGSITSKKDMEN